MKNFFNKKINTVLSFVLVLISILIAIQCILTGGIFSAGENTAEAANISNVNPKYRGMTSAENGIVLTTQKPTEPPETTEPTTANPSEKSKNSKKSTAPKTTTKPVETTAVQTIPFATAIPPAVPADYNAQWNAGYLVAIDNPDPTYQCAQVTLSDEDRDLLERLCMGEFGTGGFVGAALIAQAVKNAICFDGFTSVQAVIDGCHYTGRTDIGTNTACKQAVSYIFDENHDAVQHRIMYMYNPELVQSAFHESQNYILTYQSVRFFDRWGY